MLEQDFYIQIKFGTGGENTVSYFGETNTDRLEGLGAIAGKNLNELQRKANLVARQLSRVLDVESGVFMYDSTRANRGGIYMPFTLYLTDGNVLVGEVKNLRTKKWNKSKPMKVDYWLLNGKDITDKVNMDNPLESLITILKATRPLKKDPRIGVIEELIKGKMSVSIELTEEAKPLMELLEATVITQSDLSKFDDIVGRIDKDQNLISIKFLETMEGLYTNALRSTAL